jgi:[ribosomal protein S18]-alanine N-acetyltransferase
MKIVIRPAKFMDIPEIIKVNIECLPENYDRLFWDKQFYIGKEHCFVAVSGDIIGYVFCDQDSIISFAVQEKYRKKGIGKQLLFHCLNTFQKSVSLNVRINNLGAIHLYTSLGFKVMETIPNYYYNPREDGHKMSRDPTPIKFLEKKKIHII